MLRYFQKRLVCVMCNVCKHIKKVQVKKESMEIHSPIDFLNYVCNSGTQLTLGERQNIPWIGH